MTEPVSLPVSVQVQAQALALNDILEDLRKSIKESIDAISHNVIEKKFSTQGTNEPLPKQDVSHTEVDNKIKGEPSIAIPVDKNESNKVWPSAKTNELYRKATAEHRSECGKLKKKLGHLATHYGIIGGSKQVEVAKTLQSKLLNPVEQLDKALNTEPQFRQDALNNVKNSFVELSYAVYFLCKNLDDSFDVHELRQWENCLDHGIDEINKFLNSKADNLSECLGYIHCKFFSELESAMSRVSEDLTTSGEKSAIDWLTTQKVEVVMSLSVQYVQQIFQSIDKTGATNTNTIPVQEKILPLKDHCSNHKRSCKKMQEDLDNFIAHHYSAGGDNVSRDCNLLKENLLDPVQCLEKLIITDERLERQKAMTDMVASFVKLCFAIHNFRESLSRRKLSFKFNRIKQWIVCLWTGLTKLIGIFREDESEEYIKYAPTFFTLLDKAMRDVYRELKIFGEKSLPAFLANEMERDTTRYINITTIATFFSSVTATTLQFTYLPSPSEPASSLRGLVNLFWFSSLVFSISSGVSSLLGLTWRKSSIYDFHVTPKLISMWFDKAPMLFLIIAAISFVIGLNLFAYLSLQPRYVSFATNILTGLHAVCLLAVMLWFVYRLKHDSVWAKRIGKLIQWIGDSRVWKWIGNPWKWIKDLKIRRGMRHPRRNYRETKLHLLRNFFWAFGIDNRVARLNSDMDWKRDWSEPLLLSKLIRYIAYPIKKFWVATKKALSDVSRTVRAHICVPSPTGRTEDDIEMGESDRQEEGELPEESLPGSIAKKAKNEFRRSLQKTFTEACRVNDIMVDVEEWENHDRYEVLAELKLEKKLWGYPGLVQEFYHSVRPALVEARERSVDIVPEIVGQDEDDTASIPPQSSQAARLDDGSGPSDVRQTDVQQDSPPPDGHPLFTTSAFTEALEPTSGDPDLPLVAPVIEQGSTLSNDNQIVEAASTSGNENEGSRKAQSKEGSGE